MSSPNETAEVFQTIMLDILRRRTAFEVLEQRAIRGKVDVNNLALRIAGSDYLRSQLSDLRKFFENDPRSYKLTDLTSLLPADSKSRKGHQALRVRWLGDYRDLTNKYFFHRDKEYVAAGGALRSALDAFINDSNSFLDLLIEELNASGTQVPYLARNSSSFEDLKKSSHTFYKQVGQ